jgi:transcriptional regulator with AAA-type ATPase domain/tetratricopeptide (TPR) repeat protein
MPPLAELLGESPAIQAVRNTVGRLLAHGAEGRRLPALLILGETGTGKGLLARALHRAGPRAAGPLVEVNCAAIPETLLEAELFGFERGAFTDARQPKAGLFQTAHGGTLFLDEVGLLPAGVQAKFLKVLEDQAVRRLGATQSEPADVALVAATSEDLRDAVRARRFREDLYHRLAVVTVRLPSLAERASDILLLAEHFLTRACADYGLGPKTLTPDAGAALLAYAWPGNIRELANLMERAALLTDAPLVTADALGLSVAPERAGSALEALLPTSSLRDAVGTVEREHLLAALRETDWNIARAAARLGIPRGTLRYRIEKLGLHRAGSAPIRAGPPVARAMPDPAPLPSAEPARDAWPWERRQLAFLRAVLVPASNRDAGSEIAGALQVLVEKAGSFGGRVEALGPLGMVAAFGLESIEDAPRRAAHAAIAMQKAAERARPTIAERVGMKIAIHVSQGLVRQAGDSPVIDVAATGQAHAVLEALVAAAEPDSILVSGAAAPTLDRRFELAPVSPENATREPAYRLEGLERHGLALRGHMTPLVGRGAELEQLRHALGRTAAGHGQLVAIVGEPGVGKSRLVWEVTHFEHSRGWRIGHTSAVSYGQATPFQPVIGLLQAYFHIEDRDDPPAIREKVRGHLATLDRALESNLPALLALLDVSPEDSRWQALDPHQRRQRILDAIKRLWLREAQVQPLLLVIEDLHWVDTETQAVLDSLVESLSTARLCLLVDYRPEYQHAWSSKVAYTQLHLDPLSPESAQELLRTLLGGDPGLEQLTALLLERTEGNPFFLEETVQTLAETKVLGGERGAHSLARPIDTIEVPTTVEAVLAARIDRLAPEDKRLLQAASVIGKDVPGVLLEAIVDLPEADLGRSLATLQAAEFLYETRLFPEHEYTFKHALTHEVAYDGVPNERRRGLHARIAETIEGLYRDRVAEQVDRLAHHALRGEVWGKAVTHLHAAGLRALERFACREAKARLEEALAALTHLPDTRERATQKIDIRVQQQVASRVYGELRQSLDHLRVTRDLAEALGDRRRLGRVLVAIGMSLYGLGHHEQAVVVGREALTIGISEEDVWLQAEARLGLGSAYHALGEYGQATRVLRDNMTRLEDGLAQERSGLDYYFRLPSVLSRVWLAWCLAEQGAFAEGTLLAREGVAIAERVGHRYSHVVALYGLGYVHLLRGDHEVAIPLLERGLPLAREREAVVWDADFACALGQGYTLTGRAADGVSLMEPSIHQQETIGSENTLPLWLSWLGEAYLHLDRPADASRVTSRALALARERKQRSEQALCHRLEAEVTMRVEPLDPDAAERQYREALVLATELGMRPLVAHCHLGLGTLANRTGDLGDARKHLTTATAMYREMGMDFWLKKAEAALDGIG